MESIEILNLPGIIVWHQLKHSIIVGNIHQNYKSTSYIIWSSPYGSFHDPCLHLDQTRLSKQHYFFKSCTEKCMIWLSTYSVLILCSSLLLLFKFLLPVAPSRWIYTPQKTSRMSTLKNMAMSLKGKRLHMSSFFGENAASFRGIAISLFILFYPNAIRDQTLPKSR